MGGRVAEHEERVQTLDGGLRLLGIVHALRLVDDDDGIALCYELARATPANQLLAPAMEEVALVLLAVFGEFLVEGLDVDDHDLDGA